MHYRICTNMANLGKQTSKEGSFVKKAIGFFDKNWQAVAIFLGIAAIFIWYQALDIRSLHWGEVFDGVSLGIKETTKKLSPSVVPQIPTPLFQPQKEPIHIPIPTIPIFTTFSQKAQKGQGITHLARQALTEYLENIKPNVRLSKEQKIYIEDYLKDKTGKKRVLVGQAIAFEKDKITKAIDISGHLSLKQLARLKKYAARVPSLKIYTPVK